MAPRKIERGTQLLVEGNDELNFFEAFSDHLNIEDVQIQVFDGRDNLRGFLDGLAHSPDFRKVRSIGVVRDADESADSAFRSVQDALRNAGLPAPDGPAERAGENPSVSVFVLPGGGDQSMGSQGMLEALLCRTFAGTAVDRCIDTFLQCAAAAGTAIRRPDKARAHAWLATRPEPHVSAGVAAKKGYWNLEHEQPVVKSPASHRDGRRARLTRREEGAYRAICDRRTTPSGGMRRPANAAGTFATGCEAFGEVGRFLRSL